MRIVTWNIELGRRIDDAANQITDDTDLWPADVLLAQELSPEQAIRLSDLLGMNHHYWAPADHPKTGRPFGNAVLSPWPITEARHLALPHIAPVNGQPRGATVATVNVDAHPITAYSVHVETVLLRLRRRVDQLGPVIADLAEHRPRAAIVAGDFNAGSLRAIAGFDRTLAAVGLQPVSNRDHQTFQRFGRAFTLDHIYANGLQPESTGVGPASPTSDHRPVWAVLRTDEAGTTSPSHLRPLAVSPLDPPGPHER